MAGRGDEERLRDFSGEEGVAGGGADLGVEARGPGGRGETTMRLGDTVESGIWILVEEAESERVWPRPLRILLDFLCEVVPSAAEEERSRGRGCSESSVKFVLLSDDRGRATLGES